jgi:hypothetical protein
MASPRELAEQRRGVIPRRVRVVARPCGVRALNARTRVREQVHAGAWKGACGCPRAERAPPKGVLSPRARRASLEGQGSALEQGGPCPRGRKGLERGGPRPRKRLSLERGGLHSRASAVLSWRAAGATRVAIVLCTCFRRAS